MKIKMKNHKLVSFHRIRNMKESEMLLLDMDYLVLYSAKEIYFSFPFETTSFIIDSNSISSLENWWLKVQKSDQKNCYYFLQPCFDVIHIVNTSIFSLHIWWSRIQQVINKKLLSILISRINKLANTISAQRLFHFVLLLHCSLYC